mgnify:FL=1
MQKHNIFWQKTIMILKIKQSSIQQTQVFFVIVTLYAYFVNAIFDTT